MGSRDFGQSSNRKERRVFGSYNSKCRDSVIIGLLSVSTACCFRFGADNVSHFENTYGINIFTTFFEKTSNDTGLTAKRDTNE